MSKGPGKWQRMILETLQSRKDNTDWRRVHAQGTGKDMGLIERRYPELWASEDGSDINRHPLEYGWVTCADLRKSCRAESMVAYKALLRALDTLEATNLIQCEMIISPHRMRLARLSVDTRPPWSPPVNT